MEKKYVRFQFFVLEPYAEGKEAPWVAYETATGIRCSLFDHLRNRFLAFDEDLDLSPR
jgi:hypothetical protein